MIETRANRSRTSDVACIWTLCHAVTLTRARGERRLPERGVKPRRDNAWCPVLIAGPTLRQPLRLQEHVRQEPHNGEFWHLLGAQAGSEGARSGNMHNMPRKSRRRLNPRMTAIACAVVTELATGLSWLSGYSGGPLKEWQLPALAGSVLLTGCIGWIAISQSGAATKKVPYIKLGLP
jgi:hypothetical protein